MLNKIKVLPLAIKQYMVITANYWVFTLTDGALRMLVLLYFYQLGYSPLALAVLFIFYEFFGVVTNLVGGWLGARIGLNKTMNAGLFMQVLALLMLALPNEYLSVAYIMTAQALSGIAKDLNKMSAKSTIKVLVIDLATNGRQEALQGQLFKWVAVLTGSKNTLKGIGFFLGGFLLTYLGFQGAMLFMASVLMVVALLSMILLKAELGKAKYKPKFRQLFSAHAALNYLSAARLCLFAARGVWFVIALPVYLASQLSWSHQNIGVFFALWIILYGLVQANAPALFAKKSIEAINGKLTGVWSGILAVVTGLLLISLTAEIETEIVLIIGLFAFGVVFAINSSLHSYLIVDIAKDDAVSMDVGFYYMANALGRLLGTLLSGFLYQYFIDSGQGLIVCILTSVILLLAATLFVRRVN